MKRSTFQRILAVIACLAIFCACLAGCSSKTSNSGEPSYHGDQQWFCRDCCN